MKITLKQSITQYIKWKSSSIRSAETIYKTQLEKLSAFVGQGIFLSGIDEDDILNYYRELERLGYSDSSIAFSTRIIKGFIRYWFEKGVTKVNPTNIRVRKFVTPEQPVVELDEFQLMSELLSEHNFFELQQKLVIHLLWDTGMRVSELTDLLIENLNQNDKGIRTAKIRTKKTDIYNIVMWSEETERLLIKYLGWRLLQKHPTDLLFIRTDRKSKSGITTRTIERWVKKLSNDAMIEKPVTPHSFRHGKAHYILDNGGTAIDVQTVLRHKNMNSSLNYMRLNESKYIARASKFFENSKNQISEKAKSHLSELGQNPLAYPLNVVYNR